MGRAHGVLPPSSSLPPLARLTSLSYVDLVAALQSLSAIYCPLAFELDADVPKPLSKVLAQSADSGYASGVEEDQEEDQQLGNLQDIACLRHDAFERNLSERWLTGFLARAEGLPCLDSDDKLQRALDKASCVLESFYATTAPEDDDDDEQTYTRKFSFPLALPDGGEPSPVEVELNDGLAGKNSQDPDDVGLQSWGAAIVVSGLMCETPARFGLTEASLGSRPRIVELGAGTGLISLVLAKMLPQLGMPEAKIIATDYHPAVLANLRANILTNFPAATCTPIEDSFLDWSAPALEAPLDVPADMLVATDVVYAREHAVWLRDCAARMLKPNGVFWLVATVRQNGRFEGISETVEAAFAADDGVQDASGRKLRILQAEALEKRQNIGRGDESGYKMFRIGWV
ncbi:methyltransferase [Stachybotrys elegans]|uniref:Methyltransferase n=1 Tax=Stachybotrys elegans TaxID=80388 RepID=A0A8K0WTU2_9HYPO|nr:methyltransferase [Stachybotrys elegans]